MEYLDRGLHRVLGIIDSVSSRVSRDDAGDGTPKKGQRAASQDGGGDPPEEGSPAGTSTDEEPHREAGAALRRRSKSLHERERKYGHARQRGGGLSSTDFGTVEHGERGHDPDQPRPAGAPLLRVQSASLSASLSRGSSQGGIDTRGHLFKPFDELWGLCSVCRGNVFSHGKSHRGVKCSTCMLVAHDACMPNLKRSCFDPKARPRALS